MEKERKKETKTKLGKPPRYDEAFKPEAVRMIIVQGYPKSKVMRTHGPSLTRCAIGTKTLSHSHASRTSEPKAKNRALHKKAYGVK